MIAPVKKLDRSLVAFAESLFDGMGRPERRRAMAWYLEGLLLDGTRKSIEPMAARLVDEPSGIEAMRQRLQQCVSVSAWSDDEVRARLARKVQNELPEIEALVLDDTGFPKQGKHSGPRRPRACRPPPTSCSLRQFGPVAVLVNDRGDILYTNGRIGRYLKAAAGKAN